jgi:hypothetical protein
MIMSYVIQNGGLYGGCNNCLISSGILSKFSRKKKKKIYYNQGGPMSGGN